jgi:hypothetical protein
LVIGATLQRLGQPLDIDGNVLAIAKLDGRDLHCRLAALDFLVASPPGGSFEFVFDRGCFHAFDEPEERARFVARVAATLLPRRSLVKLRRLDRRRPAGDGSAAALDP